MLHYYQYFLKLNPVCSEAVRDENDGYQVIREDTTKAGMWNWCYRGKFGGKSGLSKNNLLAIIIAS